MYRHRVNRIYIIILILILPIPCRAQQRIKKVEFAGNISVKDDELADQMNTQPKTGIQNLLFWKRRPEFSQAVLEADMERISDYYIRNGFPSARINYTKDTTNGRLIIINVKVAENSPVLVGDVKILIEDKTSSEIVDSIFKIIPLSTGEIFRDEDIFEAIRMIKKSFSDNGFPFIKVVHKINMAADNSVADVLLTVNPGPLSYFGEISITGDTLYSERLISKYVTFSEDDIFSQIRIDSTQQDLFSTDLFRYVVIASEKDSVTQDHIPVEILVNELPRWKLETGIGYGTEDKLRLAAQLTRLNFLGGIRKLIVNAKTSYFLPFSLDTRFIQPNIFTPELDLVINPFIMREREISYSIDRMGGSVNFIWEMRKHLTSHFSYAFEYDNILDLDDTILDPAELKHNKSVFTLGGDFNSSDNMFYPSKGYKISGSVSYAGLGFSGASKFYKLQLSIIRYFPVTEDVVLAARLSAGVVQGITGEDRTPIEERFLLGGANSLRGWGRHRVYPESASRIEIGGNTMGEASAELRFPIWEPLLGVIFIDSGNVWESSYVFDDDLRYNLGTGLRFRTPIGPLRLDFATPVFGDDFDLQFFLSVGHAF